MKIKIIGDPIEAAKVLKTNRPIAHGDVLACEDTGAMREILMGYPHLFAEEGESKGIRPEQNKLLKKGRGFKSK